MRKKNKNFESSLNIWPCYVDILAAMLMIFILIGFVRNILNKETLELIQIQNNQQAFKKGLEREFSTEMNAGEINLKTKGNLQEISFSDKILFSSGSATVSPKGRVLLQRMGMLISTSMISARFSQIQVEGHTDSLPPSLLLQQYFPSNWELSAQRAINVCNFFEDPSIGIPSNLLSATAYSSNKPVDVVNIARNRRVEIRLVYFIEKPNPNG